MTNPSGRVRQLRNIYKSQNHYTNMCQELSITFL
ncbi:hypothetical protein [Escherichia phage vB-Eco-KMB35]|nr:hypothetical protein [Escherichia phage vB-Eco-KMB35]